MNEENLVSLATRTTEERRAIAKKGGVASGKARNKRKTLKEELILLLEDGDTQKNISVALIQQALEGNTKAFEVIRDSIGEKQIEQTELINKEINVVIK